MPIIERLIVSMYERTSTAKLVNEARLVLFSQKERAFDNIPPIQAALRQHIMRAVYQAGYCCSQVLIGHPQLPCPSDWGWLLLEDIWNPLW